MRGLAVCCIICKLMDDICGSLEKGICQSCRENTHELDDQDSLELVDLPIILGFKNVCSNA